MRRRGTHLLSEPCLKTDVYSSAVHWTGEKSPLMYTTLFTPPPTHHASAGGPICATSIPCVTRRVKPLGVHEPEAQPCSVVSRPTFRVVPRPLRQPPSRGVGAWLVCSLDQSPPPQPMRHHRQHLHLLGVPLQCAQPAPIPQAATLTQRPPAPLAPLHGSTPSRTHAMAWASVAFSKNETYSHGRISHHRPTDTSTADLVSHATAAGSPPTRQNARRPA